MSQPPSPLVLVSACLVGLCTRYDARNKPDARCIEQLHGATWIPVCPEQLGGLSTPRPPADIVDGDGFDVLAGQARVVTKNGQDVTRHFIRGAEQVLQLARAQGISSAMLKARSPSCGVYGKTGVTAALLLSHNIRLEEF